MLIAFCGLAGAGKTTAIDALERLGEGARVYVGAFVTAEVIKRGMPEGPESERQVRVSLREQGGKAALAELAAPTITGVLNAKRAVLVDAIYCFEEYEFYRSHFGNMVVRIAIEAARSERERRLATRACRAINSQALAERDAYELQTLGLGKLMSAAEYVVENNGSLDDLERSLQRLAVSLRR
jgi:dephospho-CoA kinase